MRSGVCASVALLWIGCGAQPPVVSATTANPSLSEWVPATPPSSSAPVPATSAAAARPRWPGPEAGPATVEHCEKVRQRGTTYPPLTPYEEECKTGILRGSCEGVMRRLMEPRVLSGRATIDEVRMLNAICKHRRDLDCYQCATRTLDAMIEPLP